MLQGLLARQAFLLLDWLLLVLILVAAVFLVLGILGANRDGLEDDAGPQADASESLRALAAVPSREAYGGIVASGLFGQSGATAAPPSPPPPPAADVAETELRLRLRGTSATTPRDILATAVIVNEETNVVDAYCIGQEVVAGVTLEEVYPRRVILLNKNANRREVLRSDEETGDTRTATASAQDTPPRTRHTAPTASNRITVKKNEIVQDLVMNYADIVSQIQPEMYTDETGKVAGITASNISAIPLAAKLDLRDGDVLQSVNSEPIDSEAKVIELVNKYRNSNIVRLQILRNGKPVVVTYRLE